MGRNAQLSALVGGVVPVQATGKLFAVVVN